MRCISGNEGYVGRTPEWRTRVTQVEAQIGVEAGMLWRFEREYQSGRLIVERDLSSRALTREELHVLLLAALAGVAREDMERPRVESATVEREPPGW